MSILDHTRASEQIGHELASLSEQAFKALAELERVVVSGTPATA